MKVDETFNVVNKKNIRIRLDNKCAHGVRNTGQCEKIIRKLNYLII